MAKFSSKASRTPSKPDMQKPVVSTWDRLAMLPPCGREAIDMPRAAPAIAHASCASAGKVSRRRERFRAARSRWQIDVTEMAAFCALPIGMDDAHDSGAEGCNDKGHCHRYPRTCALLQRGGRSNGRGAGADPA